MLGPPECVEEEATMQVAWLKKIKKQKRKETECVEGRHT